MLTGFNSFPSIFNIFSQEQNIIPTDTFFFAYQGAALAALACVTFAALTHFARYARSNRSLRSLKSRLVGREKRRQSHIPTLLAFPAFLSPVCQAFFRSWFAGSAASLPLHPQTTALLCHTCLCVFIGVRAGVATPVQSRFFFFCIATFSMCGYRHTLFVASLQKKRKNVSVLSASFPTTEKFQAFQQTKSCLPAR